MSVTASQQRTIKNIQKTMILFLFLFCQAMPPPPPSILCYTSLVDVNVAKLLSLLEYTNNSLHEQKPFWLGKIYRQIFSLFRMALFSIPDPYVYRSLVTHHVYNQL